MKKKLQNKKIIYILAIVIILIGIFVTYVWKTNVSLDYINHTRIDVHIGKEYNLEDIKQISKQVFGEQKIIYQEIETFNDSIAINIKEVTDEQIEDLKTKIAEKYEIKEDTQFIEIIELGNVRIRDIVRPYIIPTIISTLIILAYVGIRYLNLGIFKTIFALLFRLIISEALLFSIIEIVRIPVNIYTIPVALGIYMFIIIITVLQYENQLVLKKQEKQKDK